MRSKKRKKRSAYWRGEKLMIFFKRGIIVLSAFILIAGALMGVRMLVLAFPVKNVFVSGNYHLEENEIINAVDIGHGESLFRLSLDELETRLKRKAWVKNVSLRKQFPDTLMIDVKEAVPKALLSFDKHMFIIDERGMTLEEIDINSTPFLPVIIGINPEKDKGGVLEALKLINVLDEKDILSGKESIEVMLKPYGLVLNMDGEFVKVGYGSYAEKLGRWQDLETEIRKKNIIVDYVDLRFEKEVIVKPLQKAKKGKKR